MTDITKGTLIAGKMNTRYLGGFLTMKVSAVEIYKQTDTDGDLYTLMAVTSNLDGEYKGEALNDFTLGLLIRTYFDTETTGNLENIYDTDGWARIRGVFKFMREDDVDGHETTEYAILKCSENGYIKVDYYDGVRYFQLTEKCMNLELYKPRKY